MINNYESGKTKILLLNATQYACGINLIATTDIIFFHKMNQELTNQIIGRAQRFGRTENLNVHYLLYNVDNIKK